MNLPFILLMVLASSPTQTQEPEMQRAAAYYRLPIENRGFAGIEALKQDRRFQWWVELGESLVVLGDPLTLSEYRAHRVPIAPNGRLFVLAAHQRQKALLDVDVIAESGRFALVQWRTEPRPAQLKAVLHEGHVGQDISGCHTQALEFVPNQVLVCLSGNMPPRKKRDADPAVSAALEDLDPRRWFEDIVDLARLNRFTRGNEIDQARDLLVEKMAEIGLPVTLEPFQNGSVVNENVIGVLKGTERPEDIYIVGAHYDSIARDAPNSVVAPGAEDNASGTAAVLELARLMKRYPPKATIWFIGFSGEEVGLVGSTYHVQQLELGNMADRVKGVLIMDMIGYTIDSDLDVLLEGSSEQLPWLNTFADAASNYTNLNVVTSTRFFGSDHVPFLNNNMPTLLVIENDWDQYAGYHRTSDVADQLGTAMGHEILRLGAAVLLEQTRN